MSQHRTPDDDTEADRPLEGRAAPTPARSPASPANPPPDNWGRTLPLDAAALRGQFSPPSAAPVSAEPAVRIARNVYSSGTSGPPPEAQESVEPLRVPSNRPAPSPYQTHKASEKGTMLMGSTTLGQPQRGAAPVAPPVAAPPIAAPAPSPRSAVRAVAHAPETIPLANSDVGAAPMIAAAPAAAKSPRVQDPPTVTAPPSAAVRARTQQVEPPRPASQAPGAFSADAEPLQLQLNERDVVQSQVSMPPGVTSRGPMLAIVGAVIAVGVGVAMWLMSSGDKAPAAATVPATAAPAAAAPSVVQPAAPAAVPAAPAAAATPTPAPAAAAVVPSTPAVAPVQPAAKQEVEEPHAAQAKADKPASSKKHASAKQASAKAASKPAAKPKTKKPGSAASGAPVSDDVAAARDALRALEDEPVMSVKRKPKASEESNDLSPPDPSPPAPPSPD